ncbi:MAG: tetratricopeptide repeat protein [Alphaproteobacteria bacterium]|nr:tetratricopeptide repeat protein [Alphaproteobacteria bacterium]
MRIRFIGFAALVSIAICAVPLAAQNKDIDSLNNEVVRLLNAGEYTKAEPLARRALQSGEALFGPDHQRVSYAQKLVTA